ncbi:MAG TPA: SsgA family sporulation/cell division regulator [Trebonia sp.]
MNTSSTANGEPVSVELVWERQHPLIVRATYSLPGEPSWVIGRDLIADGLRKRSGEGFVTVTPGPVGSGLLLTVRRAGTSLTVFFPGGVIDMGNFLTATYRVVPRHHDIAADLDRELARIFEDTA